MGWAPSLQLSRHDLHAHRRIYACMLSPLGLVHVGVVVVQRGCVLTEVGELRELIHMHLYPLGDQGTMNRPTSGCGLM